MLDNTPCSTWPNSCNIVSNSSGVKPSRLKLEGDTPLGYVEGTAFPGSFSHIIGGYAAGYYGYMWSEVLALDMLSKFGQNIMNPEVGRRFRSIILANGGQVPAKELVQEFLGRVPDNRAFFAEISGRR